MRKNKYVLSFTKKNKLIKVAATMDLSNCCFYHQAIIRIFLDLWVQLCHAWFALVSHSKMLLGAHQAFVKGQQKRLQGWFMEWL